MREGWLAPPFKVDESNEQRCDGKVRGKVRVIDATSLSTPDQKIEDQEKNMGLRVRKQMRRH